MKDLSVMIGRYSLDSQYGATQTASWKYWLFLFQNKDEETIYLKDTKGKSWLEMTKKQSNAKRV